MSNPYVQVAGKFDQVANLIENSPVRPDIIGADSHFEIRGGRLGVSSSVNSIIRVPKNLIFRRLFVGFEGGGNELVCGTVRFYFNAQLKLELPISREPASTKMHFMPSAFRSTGVQSENCMSFFISTLHYTCNPFSLVGAWDEVIFSLQNTRQANQVDWGFAVLSTSHQI